MTAEIFDPSSLTWKTTAALPNPPSRRVVTATLLNDGKVLVAGGIDPSNNYIGLSDVFDPQTESWRSGGSMNVPRYWHTATKLTDGRVIISGGHNGNYLSSVEVYQ
ncbi:MAG: kelch repeat-containing protein [Myxococcota bacterium]